MAADRAKGDEEVQRKETWRDFVWNKREKSFLGRTGSSWVQITIFYLIFYACLAGFFAGLLHVFYATLDERKPTYYGFDSLTLNNPALGVRPMPLFDSTLIKFSKGVPSSYLPYTDHLQAFLKTYDAAEGAQACSGNSNNDTEKACVFDYQQALADAGCGSDYGYEAGTPCVIIKMNKLYDFKPEPFDSYDDLKTDLAKVEDEDYKEEPPKEENLAFSGGNIGVSCEGHNVLDKVHIKSVEFGPKGGISPKYFPYTNQKGYRSPFVVAKFDVDKRTLVQVTCKVWARNIDNTDGQEKRGSVHFEIMVE